MSHPLREPDTPMVAPSAGPAPWRSVDVFEAVGKSLLNISGMDNIVSALLGVAVLALGLSVAVRAHGGKFAKVVEMVVVVLIAALVAGLSRGTNFTHIGSDLFSTIFG
jgi:hypothetical protein